MKQHKNILQTIGNTPMVRINKLNPNEDITLLAKLEMFNPGGSIKDRMALYIIEDAEKNGLLKPGGTIVEASSGNTGIGLALVALVKRYKAIIVTPETTSKEKVGLLRTFKAKVIFSPAGVAPDSPQSCYKIAEKIAAETPDSFYVDQYNNPKNPRAHYLTNGYGNWSDYFRGIKIFKREKF
jgi:cystathionine beta-synthase